MAAVRERLGEKTEPFAAVAGEIQKKSGPVRRSGQDARALTAHRVRVEHDGSATAMSARADDFYARSFLPAPSASDAKPKGHRPLANTNRSHRRETSQKTPLLAAALAGRLSGGNKNGSVGSVPRLVGL